MKKRETIKFGIFFLFVIFSINFIFAYASSNYGTIIGTSTTTNFDSSMCSSGTDFLVQIVPLGCTPTVVRSDLLEQQDVPVFCQLSATQINPLIDVAAINSVSFNGTFPNLISGVSFWPAKSALGTSSNSLDNIGYVKILLKQQINESSMPDYVFGNLTANIKYDLQDSLGIGTASLYLPQMSDDQWQATYPEYGFWNGEGYIRATDVQNGKATISVSDSNLAQISSFTLNTGDTSNKVYVPGLNCLAGFSVKLNSVQNPDERAILKINADNVQVANGEYFLNNKCMVRNLDKKGLTQSIDISCSEDQNGFYNGKTFTLSISPKIILKIKGVTGEYSAGDYLYDSSTPGKYVYLAYVGTKKDSNKKEDLYAYLLETPSKKQNLSSDELNSFNGVVERSLSQNNGAPLQKIESILQGVSTSSENFLQGKSEQLLETGIPQTFEGTQVSLVDLTSPSDVEITATPFLNNFNNAVTDYNDVTDNFAGEKYPNNSLTTLSETALINEIKLMDSTGQKKTLADLCSKLKINYPDASLDICSNIYNFASSGTSSADVLINGKTEQISFVGIYQPSSADYGAEILIRSGTLTAEETLGKNQIVYLKDLGFADKGEFIQLTNLDDSSASLKINLGKTGSTEFISSDNNKIALNSLENFGSDYTFTLEKVNLKKVASVSVIPNIGTTGSKASFQFKVAIEKRWNVTLIPEAMKSEIQTLNKSISTLQNISSGLATFVQYGKTACLATGAVLVVKNFAEAFSGSAIARTTVMRGAGGWNDICASQVSSLGGTLDKCFLDNADKINNDVDTLANLMTNQNTQLENLEPAATNILGQKSVDSNALATKLCTQDSTDISNIGQLVDSSGLNPINLQDMKTILSNSKDTQSCRDIQLYMNVMNSGTASSELKTIANKSLYSGLFDLQTAYEKSVIRLNTANSIGIDSSDIGTYLPENAKKIEYSGLTYKDIKSKVTLPGIDDPNTPIQLEQYGNQVYVVVLNDLGTNLLPIKTIEETSGLSIAGQTGVPVNYAIYDLKGNLISNPQSQIPELGKIYFEKLDTKSYKNQYKNYQIKFYDTEPYKGMPAIVPFDINNGWYAATTPTLPVLGNLKTYDESGKISSFWVCNVGANGIEENRAGDDKCEQINLNTGQPLNTFNGLSTQEATNRIAAAQKAIDQASTQKASGSTSIKIDVGYGAITFQGTNIATAANIPDVQCQDFMSPTDCATLFNVCDPFICPSSRCNLGGAYTVPDVIQSGILGSIALCFPNFIGLGGTDVLPVCITGVQAGIDAFISVQKSYRDCLQDAVNTGRVRGICDEIHGMYLCDFIWKQAAPFARALLPNIISAISGQVKGGGEYLTINSAFDNAEKSANYFVQYYGANAGTAFDTRSAEQFIGDAICKASSSSIVYPSGGDLLSSITKPSSPPQFTGRFEETPFTSVTNPPISQYNVYYHIFAGNDAGAYYQVYLRGTGSSVNIVASGYAPAGESADDTKVFTAVAGYKQLCINVNGQEECGFQEVSTSFAVDYLQQSYVASQVNNSDIQTTVQCNSGTIPLSGLELYNQGVTRICATDNPGTGTDPYIGLQNQRWVEVGYCDDQNIKCWLDTNSVNNVITIGTIQNQTANDIESMLQSQGNYMSKDEFTSTITTIEQEKNNPSQEINDINNISARIFYNDEKGYATLLRGEAYSILAISNKPLQTSQAQATTQTSRTYNLDKIGFQLNNNAPNFGPSDVGKGSNSDKIILAVVDEANCDRTEYQVFETKENFLVTFWNRVKNTFTGSGLFNPDEPKSAHLLLQDADNFLNSLSSGTYYVIGYCYNNQGKTTTTLKSGNNLVVANGLGSNTIPSLQSRYTSLKSYFNKYASQYKPQNWDLNSFEALLIAIAQRQSNLGYPQGVLYTDWLMEYGWTLNSAGVYARDSAYSGADNQVKNAAETLNISLNGAVTTSYSVCNQRDTNNGKDPANDDRLYCTLSVYMTGINEETSTQGAEAANEVIQLMVAWKSYLDTGSTQGISNSR